MKNIINIAVVIIIAISLTSCFNKKKPNYRYMPNMYTSLALEANGEYAMLPNGQVALLPAEGTIPRGWMPYEYKNTLEGKVLATTELKNPLEVSEENLTKGKELFTIFCTIFLQNVFEIFLKVFYKMFVTKTIYEKTFEKFVEKF